MTKVYIIVREDNQAYVTTFKSRSAAEKFLLNFRVKGSIVEAEVQEDPNE
jgi:hypothetical protein